METKPSYPQSDARLTLVVERRAATRERRSAWRHHGRAARSSRSHLHRRPSDTDRGDLEGVAVMIPIPQGSSAWFATGHTDMRKGFVGVALIVQETLEHDPHSEHLFVFRGRRGRPDWSRRN
jgi:transposase